MKPIILGICCYILIAAILMAISGKKVKADIAKQRWLKYGTYLLITALVIASILLKFFLIIAITIVVVGYYELIMANHRDMRMTLKALIIFSIIVLGFALFAFNASMKFQFFLYFQVFTFDAFCQVTGQLFGKTSIAPKISSAKTVEGLIGGIIFCLTSSLLAAEWLGANIFQSVLLALITSATAFSGDMLASWYKRVAGIKDYSSLLPGQGGFLDRFDSLLMAGCCYGILALVSPTMNNITS